jgi:glycosyltransferase involved in cell wall biosynthesis
MTNPLLSVLVPVRDGERFIGEALRSVLACDADIEVLVQDGCSTDRTADVVASIGDKRVSFVSESDEGQADALNRALQRARGQWILWLNADDLIDPRAVERLLPTLATTSADLVYGDFAIINAEGGLIRQYTCPPSWSQRDLLTRGMRVFSGSIVMRRRFLLDEQGFDEHWQYCMDYELLVRASPRLRAQYAPGVVGSFRLHAKSKSIDSPWRFVREYREIHARYRQVHWWDRMAAAVERGRITVFTLTAPLRYSQIWSRVRRVKAL